MEQELYVASGADDVYLIHDASGLRSLVLWLPGSWTWYRLWIDDEYRVQRETIVNPVHLIERAFSYGPHPTTACARVMEASASRWSALAWPMPRWRLGDHA